MTDLVLDYTSRISPAALKLSNVVGVCRYVSVPIASTAWKCITKPEYDELIGAGIDVTLNFEYDARDWLGGGGVGKAHGAIAVSEVAKVGYPKGRVIPGSCDFDMTRAQWDQSGRAYAVAFRDVVRMAGYRPGVYGPWDVLEWCKSVGYDAFWQAGMSTAWSNGRNANPWPGAHFRQRRHMMVGGTDTDMNDILIRPLWKGLNMRDATIYRDARNGACVVESGRLYYGIPDMAQMVAIQSLITKAGGDASPRDLAANEWDVLHASCVDVAKVGTAGTSIVVSADELAAAVSSNVDKIAAAFASHVKVV
jgi:hypothetical protein